MTTTHTPLVTAHSRFVGTIDRFKQQRINGDLDMLIESDRAMTPKAMIAWLVDNYAMTEPEANKAYRAWMKGQ